MDDKQLDRLLGISRRTKQPILILDRESNGAHAVLSLDSYEKLLEPVTSHEHSNTSNSVCGTETFGVHLTIDGYGGDPKKLNDGELVKKCLNELPGLINMEKLAEPVVYLAPACSPKDTGGFSGVVVITTSHISCHTFPGRRFVSIDCYTCHDHIDVEFVKQYFINAFSLEDVETNYFKRGTRFPSVELA